MSGFSNDTAWKATKMAFKAVFYVFKALWLALTYGFRAYKKNKDKQKQQQQQEQQQQSSVSNSVINRRKENGGQ